MADVAPATTPAPAAVTPDAKGNISNYEVVGANGQKTYYSGAASGLSDYQRSMGSNTLSTQQPGSPSLIVTSNASRAQFAQNTTDMQNSNAAVTPPATTATGDTTGKDTTGAGGANGTGDGKPAATATDTGTEKDTEDPTAALPPGLASMFKQQLTAQDQSITAAKTALATAAATLNNDPAAQSAAAAISAQYDVLINAMKEKNRQVLGGAAVNAARSGGLQFANDMTETFMSNEMDRATQRISDLVAKEQSLILASNAAYKNKDVAAFNAAQTSLNKVQADKTATLGKLMTATNNQVKAVQAQQKIDAQAAKDALAADTTTSTKIAAGMVAAIKAAGITDPAQIKAYIEAMAEKNGITNTDILAGAFETARQTSAKTDASLANTASEIRKRGSTSTPKKKTTTDGGYTYTEDDVATYTSLLNKGGTAPDGTKYNGRGSDTFVDPGAYVAAYNDWIKNNGTPAGFLKKFPITNVNPESYPNLPAGLRPKAKAAAAVPPS